MDAEQLHACARDRAQELPASSGGFPFGPDHEVFKVCGKVFLLMTELSGVPVATLKADPADAELLRGAHEDITPGYHMNKRHWVTVRPGGPVDESLLRGLVTESYLLVVQRLPRDQQPVDPESFGRG